MALAYEQYSELWGGSTVYDCNVLHYYGSAQEGSHLSVRVVSIVLPSASFHLAAVTCPILPVGLAVLACNEHSVINVGYTTKQCHMHAF